MLLKVKPLQVNRAAQRATHRTLQRTFVTVIAMHASSSRAVVVVVVGAAVAAGQNRHKQQESPSVQLKRAKHLKLSMRPNNGQLSSAQIVRNAASDQSVIEMIVQSAQVIGRNEAVIVQTAAGIVVSTNRHFRPSPIF